MEIRVVLVETLEERLASHTDFAVLSALAHGDELLTTVSATASSCALVSYKQEREATNNDSFDEFTLDGRALRGIVAAARSLKMNAIWLDAWCYRSPNGAYDHEDFTRTLRQVVEGVDACIWLPRSKVGSKAEYAYRLWRASESQTPRAQADQEIDTSHPL
jgi:hypothetical protein